MVLDHHLLDGYSGMTLIAFQDGKPIFRDGKVGTEQSCCCEPVDETCAGCFLDFSGTYNWTFTGTCNGNPVNLNGTIVDGVDNNVFMLMACTEDAICAGDPYQQGLFFSFFDGACAFRGFVAGGIFDHPCSTARTVVGTYELTSCAGNGTGTLVIS